MMAGAGPRGCGAEELGEPQQRSAQVLGREAGGGEGIARAEPRCWCQPDEKVLLLYEDR